MSDDDEFRGEKLYIIVQIAQVASHLSQHPDVAKKLREQMNAHTEQMHQEEEH